MKYQSILPSYKHETIVVKFGSSVLSNLSSLVKVAKEIKSLSKKYNVVAVVSALGGTTDILTKQEQTLLSTNDKKIQNPAVTALLLSTGEIQSAALVTTQLTAMDIDAKLITNPIIAKGEILEARPISCKKQQILQNLEKYKVVIVPGFIAEDTNKNLCLLGRGGSDLSALFIAHELNAARCILVKDVPGVYNKDPNKHNDAKAYKSLTYEDALNCSCQIIQDKALLWAKENLVAFHVSAIGSQDSTVIGAIVTQFRTTSKHKMYAYQYELNTQLQQHI